MLFFFYEKSWESHAIWAKASKDENGHALPSILLLITILSLVAVGLISLVFLQHQLALREVSRVKAEYAAQSGIAMICAQPGVERQSYPFDDGTKAQVVKIPWGMFQIVRSEGTCGKSQSTRLALSGLWPPHQFQQALVFGNASHQLVFAGTSSVTGNVVVGNAGVTTGILRNVRTPPRIPITGTITKTAFPTFPQLETDHLLAEIVTCQSLLDGSSANGSMTSHSGSQRLEEVPDSVESIRIVGDLILLGTIVRREQSLRIAVNGKVTLNSGTSMRGLVCLYATEEISLSVGASTEHAILMSRKSIELKPGCIVLGQVIAPLVQVDSGAVAKYPSVVVSFPVDSVGQAQRISIQSGARVEGLVALAGTSRSSPQENIVEIEQQAIVVGVSYSENRTTLDGTVIGSVFTKDFYFYEAPTQYLGWIRNGIIDRNALPSGFLVPGEFSGGSRLAVLDWL